jgi:hypothetical protein
VILNPEKRKVGGSTPPLTTTSELLRCFCRFSFLCSLANAFANANPGLPGRKCRDACPVLTQDMGVDPQRHCRVGVAEPGGDHVDRDACQQQCGGVQVAKTMQPGTRERGPISLLYWLISLVMSAVTI